MQYRLRTLLIVLASLVAAPSFGQDNADPGEALYGQWEVVEMVYRGKLQDFKGKPKGWFVFQPGTFVRLFGDENPSSGILEDKLVKKFRTNRCTIRPREFDFIITWGDMETPVEALYEFEDGKLRIVWTNEGNHERPKHFDALRDSRLTFFELKKVK